MINATRPDQWSEDMYLALMPVLGLLVYRMKHLDINNRTGVGGVDIGMSKISALEDNWEGKLNEVAASIDGVDFSARGRWSWSHMECADFAENHLPVGQFQWFLDIFIYLHYVTGEMVSTAESQREEVHASKACKTKEHSIVISVFFNRCATYFRRMWEYA